MTFADGAAKEPGHADRRWLGLDRFDLAALVIVLVFVIAGLFSIGRTTPTVDEPNHFTRGLAILQTGDARLSFAHPPAANTLAALPAALSEDLPRVDETRAWDVADPGDVGMALAAANYPAFRRGIMRGRAIQLLWGVALLWSVFRFTRRQLGDWAAVAAMVTLACCPTFVAHATLVTTDAPVTTATFWLMTAAWEHGRTPTRATAVRAGLASALVPIVKLSGPLLLIIALVVFVVARGRAPSALGDARTKAKGMVLHVLAAGLIMLLSINLAYGGDRSGLTVAQIRAEPEPIHFLSAAADGNLVDRDSIISRLPATLRVPVPYPYVYGLAVVRAQAKREAPNWFLGKTLRGGHPAYVPLMLFAKSPIAWWILLGIVVVQTIRKRTWPEPAALFAVGIALVYALLASRSNAQLGVRYLLPAFPFVAVAASSAFLEPFVLRRRGVLVGVVATTPLALVLAGGDNLGWFNPAVGGRTGGHRIAMIGEDWAQDLGRLTARVNQLDADPLYFDVYNRYGPVELRYQGVSFTELSCRERPGPGPGWVAVHRARELRYGDRCYPWRDRVIEVYDVAHHMRLYRLGPVDDAPRG